MVLGLGVGAGRSPELAPGDTHRTALLTKAYGAGAGCSPELAPEGTLVTMCTEEIQAPGTTSCSRMELIPFLSPLLGSLPVVM